MQLFYNFGFEPILFLGQIVNFLIIFWVMKKFLYKPFLKMLDERKHKISEGLKNAEEAEKRLQEVLVKEEQILQKAQEEAKMLLQEAKKERDDLFQQAEIKTKERVEAMLKEAKDQISFESAQVEKKLTTHVSRLAITFLQQSMHDLFGEQEQELIMKNTLKKLKKKAD